MVSEHNQSLQLTCLDKFIPLICQQQPRLNYKRRVSSAHTRRTYLKHPAWVKGEVMSLDPTGHLLH